MGFAHKISVVVVVAIALFVQYSDAQGLMSPSTKPNPFKAHCGMTERSRLFNQCLQSFGLNQLSNLFIMARANRCLVDKLDCGLAGKAATCINRLLWPTGGRKSPFTTTCKAGIKETLSYLMMQYRFNCSYRDLECKCWRSIPDISAAAARGQGRTAPPQGCAAGSG